jgi:hypothetical protein
MSPKAHRSSGILKLCVLGLVLGAAGCSADDIQFNGGVFDAMGLSDSAKSKSSSGDPKLAERAPLVVPPKLDNLPQPGEPEAAPDSQIAGIHDPDAVKQASEEELRRQQAAYCKEHYEIPKGMGDDSADSATGPLGPCRPSVLNSIAKWNSDDSE